MTDETLNKYLLWIDQGESFSKIRKDLTNNGVDQEDVKSILGRLDHIVADRKLRKMNASQGLQWIIAGSILLIFSLILFVIAFLPLLFFASAGTASGVTMILWGKKKIKEGINLKSSDWKEEFKKRT